MKAILITYDREGIADEAAGLCDTAGYQIVHTVRQRFLKKPKYGVSSGVLERLEEIVEKMHPDVIIYDEILKPSQNYNLASALHIEIMDREMLILEIFESRASSAESRLQVKLAQLRYEMSRARERVRLSRMGEQPGFMGIGKFEVDVYYNDIKHRINMTRAKLKKSGKQRELHRQARKRMGFRTISLAGYTSAGKTTLFNRLTGEERAESDELFTTLSTTTRRLEVRGEQFLVSDTVGFINKLPAYMIDAFKSTLEELLHAEAVVVVIDAGDPPQEMKKKFSSCMRTLGELGVQKEKMIYALNKADLIGHEEINYAIETLRLAGRRVVPISAKTGENARHLKETIKDVAGVQYGEEYRGARRLDN